MDRINRKNVIKGMKRIFIYLTLSLLLSSCTFSPPMTLTISPYSDTPWEEVSGKEMWYKVKWFDGNKVETLYLDRGVWSMDVEVGRSSLLVFVFYPLGDMEPLGGFWEPGGKSHVWLSPEEGYFASMLISVAETYPMPVSNLSVKRLKEAVPDLGAIDRGAFVYSLIEGKLDKEKIPLYKKYKVPLDGVPKGKWVSLYSHSSSIIVSDVFEPGTVSLFPGVYHYISFERDLMLTVNLEEDGRYYTKISAPREW